MRCTSTKTCDISVLLTHSGDDITLLFVRSTQLLTWSFSRHKCFTSTNHNFKYHSESQSFWISLRLVCNIHYYVTTTAFLTLPVYHQLKNAQWADEYSVRKINPDIHLMWELHETVELHRATNSLSDADSQFFPNQRNSCSFSFLNTCITEKE
jgi:hypothetical protein